MNKQEIEKAISNINYGLHYEDCGNMVMITKFAAHQAMSALEKQIPKKVYYFQDDDCFETACCGIDVTGTDYNFCPNCGTKLGEVERLGKNDELRENNTNR